MSAINRVPNTFAVNAAAPLALLLAAASLGGIFMPSVYAKETANWAAQGIGQDWANLLLVAPALLLAGWAARREGNSARPALGGLYLYVAYSFLIYALAMHFNALFFVYCGVLGVSTFAALALGASLRGDEVKQAGPVGLVGGLLLALAAAFGALWLSEDVPAWMDGAAPSSLGVAGLITNPVHVLDLALVIPAFACAGVSLLRRRPLGLALAPPLLAFAACMALAISAMMLSLTIHGMGESLGGSAAFAGLAGVCAVVERRLAWARMPLAASTG